MTRRKKRRRTRRSAGPGAREAPGPSELKRTETLHGV